MTRRLLVGSAVALVLAVAACGSFFTLDRPMPPSSARSGMPRSGVTPSLLAEPVQRALLAREFRGIYVSAWTAGVDRFHDLVDLVDMTPLNGLVIDVKDSSGKVGYASRVPLVAEIGAHERRIPDLDGILRTCRERGIHTVARIAVFQDPVLARARPQWAVKSTRGGIWKDQKGLSWVDPAAPEVWAYNLALAKEAAALGFDEVQFDYVRFPTDGKLATISYPVYRPDVPKYEVIRRFFAYLDQGLKPVNVLVSADVFGQTVLAQDDLEIGQRLEDIAPYVDFVCPMIYPSHFAPGHLGLKNPAAEPYRVIFDSCRRGIQRLEGKRARLRPWLQDFKLGGAYDAAMVRDQIQAARDAGTFGFALWNARNHYTSEAYQGPLPEPRPQPPVAATPVKSATGKL